MTKAHSEAGDNNGNCEACDKADGGSQQTVSVMLGGGLGMGTMWMCQRCVNERGGTAEIKVAALKNQNKSSHGCRVPCTECPYSRKTEPGKLGGSMPAVFIGQALGPFLLSCHMDPDYEKNNRSPALLQCAGAAIFRANIGAAPLLPAALMKLETNIDLVFATPAEFLVHHAGLSMMQAQLYLLRSPPLHLLQIELAKQGVQQVDMTKDKK